MKKPFTVLFLMALISPCILHALPPHAKTVTYDGPQNLFEGANGVAVDASGNVYVIGVVYTDSLAVTDIWIGKYDSLLTFQSERVVSSAHLGNSLPDQGRAIEVDGNGNVYVVGSIYTSPGDSDIWVAKLDTSLNIVSSATFNGPTSGFDEALGMTLSGSDVIVTGRVNSAAGFVPWVGRYNSSLVLQSSATVTETGVTTAYGEDVAVDGNDNVYVAGFRIAGTDRIRVWKFNSGLVFQSSVTVGNATARGQSIVFVPSNNSLYVGGFSRESGIFRSWVGRFDTALTQISSHSYNSSGTQASGTSGIAFDSTTEKVYVTGYVEESTSPAKLSFWVAEYSASLGFLSEATINGTFAGVDGDAGNDILVNSSGEILVVGDLYATNTLTGDTDAAIVLFSSIRGVRSGLDSVKVFPNPYQPALGHTYITITNLPAGTVIKIFTLTGLKVTELKTDSLGTASWDGHNESGAKVASGVYFGFVEHEGSRKTFKIGVQR